MAQAQAFWVDEGPRTWKPRPTVAAITANDLRTRLYQLADDSMMGREAGTRGNVMATDYIAAEFKRLGLVPAGENGSYFQEIGYGRLQYDSSAARLVADGRVLEPGREWSPVPPNAGSRLVGRAALTDAPVVFGGVYGDTAAKAILGDVRGKVIVVLPPTTTQERLPNGQVRTVQAAGDYTWMQQAGAAALIQVGNPSPMVFRARTGMLPTIKDGAPAAVLTAAAASSLFGGQALEQLTVGARGVVVSGDWNYRREPLEYPTRNVLAVLPGSDPALKGQYVIVGAHSDHVGMIRGDLAPDHDSLRAFNTVLRPQGANDRVALDAVTPAQWAQINDLIAKARKVRPARRDTVNNGADDDGSGTAVLLEIAEALAKGPRPRRSILFNSHAAEEKGLLGSSWWVDNPTIPLDSVVAAHNMDMLGKGRVTDVKFGGPNAVQMLGSRRLSAEFGDLIDSLNAVRSEPMVIDYSWDRTNALNRFCRSDQVSYIRKNVPTTYFSLGYSRDYHQPTDEPQY
ncbi:MAG: M28 family peptidase, partial [Candidatus Nanopelagicales bacterium]